MLDTTRGPQQLIQLVERGRPLYALAAAALAGLAIGLAATCRSFAAVLRSPGACSRSPASPSTSGSTTSTGATASSSSTRYHVAFPLLLLLAQLYEASAWRWRRGVLAVALVAVFASNLEAARGVRVLVDRECAKESTQPREPCQEWR